MTTEGCNAEPDDRKSAILTALNLMAHRDADPEKALRLIEGKLAKNSSFDYQYQGTLSRILGARGFDEETIHSVIHRPWKERS